MKCLIFDILGPAPLPLSIVDETIQRITIGVIVSNTGYSKLAPTNRPKLGCAVSTVSAWVGDMLLNTSLLRSQSVNSPITKAHCQLMQSPGLR